jgi:GNAT superfamily N-acetyltransferase
MNKTGMEGYIPENILVYIAVDRKFRGKGYGKELMIKAIRLPKEASNFMLNMTTLPDSFMRNWDLPTNIWR